jgi:hypothetical protein
VQVGQAPVALLDVEAVSHEELVGNGETDVADGDVLDQPAIRAIEQRHRGERSGLAKRQGAAEVVERQPGVDDVFHDDDVAAGDLVVEILQQPDPRMPAGVAARGVARQLDEVDPMDDVDRAREIGQEDDAGLQRRDEQRLTPLVVSRDLPAQLPDAPLQLLAREVDLAGALPERAQLASSSLYRSARRSMSRL